MPKKRNEILEKKHQPSTIEQLAELEIYIDSINLLASRISRTSLGGLLSSLLIIRLWSFPQVCTSFLVRLLQSSFFFVFRIFFLLNTGIRYKF